MARKLAIKARPEKADVPIDLLLAVINGQPDEAIAIFDRDLRILTANQAWLAATGFGPDKFGCLLSEFFGEAALAPLPALLEGREMIYTSDLDPGGELGQVVLTPWKDHTGQVRAIISRYAVGEAQSQVQISRERLLRLAMDMAEIHAFRFDFRSGEGQFDPAQPGQVGPYFSHEDVLAMLPAEERDEQRALWRDHLSTLKPIVQEYQTVGNHGAMTWYRSVSEAVQDRHGKVIGMVGVTQVIEDRKRAEVAMRAEKEAADAANRAKSQFLANMSHEIRTPLNGVLGLASVLAKTQLDVAQGEMVRTIESSAQTLNALLSDILDLAKIEAGRLALEAAPYDPIEVIGHIHKLFSGAATAKGLRFGVEIDLGVPTQVLGDRNRLTQILINLVSNAIKFTARGAVTLRARMEGAGPGQHLEVAVADSGIGISGDELGHLFERFVQADGSTSRSFGGTGLGLAISRDLARLMGGDVTATSLSGVGSVFTATIGAPPSTSRQASAPARQMAPAWGDGSRPRVLLVEDHPVNRRVVELILGELVSLVCVENGQEAVSAFAGQRFDLILMDMQMPVMDGLEATRAIRAVEQAQGAAPIPIVMLSANALAEHVQQGHDAGAQFHLAKPVTADGLIEMVATALDWGAAHGPSREDQALSA
jgi:signal transduction histidine kinase/CheY-like chemotaxis protein